MKSLIVIVVGLYLSWRYTELGSFSTLQGVLAPLGVFVFLVALACWLVIRAGFGARTDHGGGYGSGGDFGGGCGGDGGGD